MMKQMTQSRIIPIPCNRDVILPDSLVLDNLDGRPALLSFILAYFFSFQLRIQESEMIA